MPYDSHKGGGPMSLGGALAERKEGEALEHGQPGMAAAAEEWDIAHQGKDYEGMGAAFRAMYYMCESEAMRPMEE